MPRPLTHVVAYGTFLEVLSGDETGEQMKLAERILWVVGAVSVALSIWSGNQPGLFGIGLICLIIALVLWGVGRGRARSA